MNLYSLPHLLSQWLTVVTMTLMFWVWSAPVQAQSPVCADHPTGVPSRLHIPTESTARSTLDNGGIGGTGDKADAGIGIIGTVTGFASICLNGQEIHYDMTTPMTRNGIPARADALAVGQVVAIDAIETPLGLVARHVHLMNILEGPVTHAPPGSGEMTVMNQPVIIDSSTHLDGLNPSAPLNTGTSVRVSGFRDPQGKVRATRIEMAPHLTENSSIGMPNTGSSGEIAHEMLIRGHWNGHLLETSSTHPSPSISVTEHAHRVMVEGMILESKNPSHLRITGFDVSLGQGAKMPTTPHGTGNPSLAIGQRIQVMGHMDRDRHIVADTLTFSPTHSIDTNPKATMPQKNGPMPSDQPMMMDRMSIPDMPQRMNSMPMPHPKNPSTPGMPKMPM